MTNSYLSTCVVSVLRLLGVIQAFTGGEYDLVWGGQPIMVWMSLEIHLAIVCCCLPPLRPLAARLSSNLKFRERTHMLPFSFKFGGSRTSESNSNKLPDSKDRASDEETQYSQHKGSFPLKSNENRIKITTTTSWESQNNDQGKSPC